MRLQPVEMIKLCGVLRCVNLCRLPCRRQAWMMTAWPAMMQRHKQQVCTLQHSGHVQESG
jgi:hypothetical protein